MGSLVTTTTAAGLDLIITILIVLAEFGRILLFVLCFPFVLLVWGRAREEVGLCICHVTLVRPSVVNKLELHILS